MVKLLYILHLYSWASWWCKKFHQNHWRFIVDRLRLDKPTCGWCFKCGRMWQEKHSIQELILKGVSEEVKEEHGL
jgi:hypothetical protein